MEALQVAGRWDEAGQLLAEAVAMLRSKQQPDGSWLLEDTHPGAVHFSVEDGDGRPSRWNTLRALRVLRWYDHHPPSRTDTETLT